MLNTSGMPPIDIGPIARFLDDGRTSQVDFARLTISYLKLRISGPILAKLQAPTVTGETFSLTARWIDQTRGAKLTNRLNHHSQHCHHSTDKGRTHLFGPGRAALHAPHLGVVFIAFPFDRRLSMLPLVADRQSLQSWLGAALKPLTGSADIGTIAVRPVRYKAESKCVFRVEIEWADDDPNLPTAVYGKVAKDAIFHRTNSLAPALSRLRGGTEFLLSRPLALIDELNLDVQSEVPGRSMAELLATGEGGGLGQAVGTALRSLHHATVELPTRRTVNDHTSLLADNAEQLTRFRPAHRSTVQRLMSQIDLGMLDDLSIAPRVCHNDFHGANVLVGAQLGLIDFEDAAMGDPANDVGSMFAHLTDLAFRHPHRRTAILAERADFLRAYNIGDLRGRFAFYAAGHFVMLAYQSLRYPGEEAEQRIEPLLASATAVLSGGCS